MFYFYLLLQLTDLSVAQAKTCIRTPFLRYASCLIVASLFSFPGLRHKWNML